ncbi:MAG: hypothetical protein WCA22_19355 [Candidatus Binatus sp.]
MGVSLSGRDTPLREPELQRRLLDARADRRNAILNWGQTIGIIGTLLVTLFFSARNRTAQVNQTSGDFMLRFDDKLNAGGSGRVSRALDNGVPLTGDKDVSDDDIDDFLSNYELLAAAYRHELINRDMAEDAFSYDLEKALKEPRIEQQLVDERREESDIYDGVLELARAWNISTDLTVPASPTSASSPTTAPTH